MDTVSYDDKLRIVAWVFENILAHAREGGSFRYLIYNRLGFDIDAYFPLYEAGGMEISNEFNIDQMLEIRRIIRKEANASAELKSVLGMCDEFGCYEMASCGFPTENGYRRTCYEHSNFNKKDAENE